MDIDSYIWSDNLHKKQVYKYWKESYGLVTGSYAKKVLGVGWQKFRQIRDKYKLQTTEIRAPGCSWDVKFYKLTDIYNIKETLKGSKGD